MKYSKGLVIKNVSNFSYVEINKKIYECSIRGLLRQNNVKPIVGDFVEINFHDLNNPKKGIIEKIYKRKNELLRPLIANVDQVVIVTSAKEPRFSTILLNRYLFSIECKELVPILIFTKSDLLSKTQKDQDLLAKIMSYQKLGYQIQLISNIKPFDSYFPIIQKMLENKISVFTGQTGAGKSSTINNLLGNTNQKVDKISKFLGRGKHTTRVVELIDILNGKIADTPGFSSFSIEDVDPLNISNMIKPFKKLSAKCKFNNCLHISEPHCFVKKQFTANKPEYFFYLDYLKIIQGYGNDKNTKY